MKKVDRIFVICAAIVALSTAVLPEVRGYGTVLFQFVVLGAWSIIARLSSGAFADTHHGFLWLVALILNVLGFSIVGVPIWTLLRTRSPKLAAYLVICWVFFYVGMLFFLFPATDGP